MGPLKPVLGLLLGRLELLRFCPWLGPESCLLPLTPPLELPLLLPLRLGLPPPLGPRPSEGLPPPLERRPSEGLESRRGPEEDREELDEDLELEPPPRGLSCLPPPPEFCLNCGARGSCSTSQG